MTAPDSVEPNEWPSAFAILRDLEHLEGDALTEAARKRCEGDAALESAVVSLLSEHTPDSVGIIREIDSQLGIGPATSGHGLPQIEGIELTHLLGQGGSGDVYAGRQHNPDRDVAVKVLRSGLSSRRAVARFAREAKALAAITHESVAAIHAVTEARLGNDMVAPCLVMEYVRGNTLRDTDKPMPLREAATLAASIARGLHAAHQRGVVHRDLKPTNVIIDEAGNPRIIDFGVAALQTAGASVTMHTITGELLGTLGYMSPEQIDGSSDVADVRIDIYAIGILFYELLTGEPAVDVRSSTSMTSVQTIMNGTLPKLAHGGDADAVYRKATAVEASRRYDSAAALADDLERLAEGRPVTARPPSALYAARLFARRHPWPVGLGAIAATAVIALSVAVVVGFMTASRERDAAVLAENRASEASAFLRGMLASPDPDVDGPDVRVVDVLAQSARQIDALHADDPIVAMDLHRTLGWTYASLSQHAEATEHLGEAVTLASDNLASTDPELLELETNLADSYVYVGRFDEAVELMESVLERCRQTPTTPASTHAAALVGYAETLRNVGRLDEGIHSLHQARVIAFEAADAADPQYLSALSGLGQAYLEQSLAAEAAAVYQRLVSVYEQQSDGPTSGVLTARGNLAIALATEGRHDEALELYERVLREGEPVLGDMHHTMRMVRGILPDSYFAVGESEAALAMSRRAMDDANRVHGRGHPDELLTVSNHAVLLMQLGRSDEALAYTTRLYDELPSALGPEHRRTLIGMRNHAAVLDNIGRDEEAADVFRSILASQRNTLGDGHFDTMITKNNLAFLLNSIDGSEEAATLMQSVVDLAGPESGLPDPARAIFQLNLGRSLIAIGEFERAADALQASYDLQPNAESHITRVNEARAKLAEEQDKARSQEDAPVTEP